MEEIVIKMTEEKMEDYMKTNVQEGDHIEVYFGRCHVEGTVDSKEDGFFRVDTDNKSMGLMEFDIGNIARDVLEIVHINEEKDKKVILVIE
ncbi:conserved hypothetical protein [Methanococcus vannielii SB]|jgi:hypothetical protein|uniref:Uncharacterized protein n=1 Tax=Methanococcus vannielii (strain ATCC 35089 / DSM 1224 / JCM 13029 / OCM 148 / SB) TaxID=406327 RepID=A6URW5_METVS|nr:DUF2097 domain-containing protein [Methanococcus vannielii]ABR55237.1 conserved hypothetical protein [Methanococcus vannielii SB]